MPWSFNACKRRIEECTTPEARYGMWNDLNMWVYAGTTDPYRWACYWAFMDAWETLYKTPEWIDNMEQNNDDLSEF